MACIDFQNFITNCGAINPELSDGEFKKMMLNALMCINANGAGGGAAAVTPRPSVVDGYTGTTAIGATTNITFAAPVKSVFFWSNGTNIVPITYTIVGGLGNKIDYVPAGGTKSTGISAGFITAISFINNSTTAAMTYIVSGVDGGVP